MSYLDSAWTRRVAIAIDNSGGSAGTGDVRIPLSSVLPDVFWEEALASGDDIRVTQADGLTVVPHQLVSWNRTARTGSIELDGFSFSGAGICMAFLYWGNASAPNVASPFVASGPKDGTIAIVPPSKTYLSAPQDFRGAGRARDVLSKNSSETIRVAVDFGDRMLVRRRPFANRNLGEEIDRVTVAVSSGGTPIAGMADESRTLFHDPHCAEVEIKGGTSGTDYLVTVTAVTTAGQVLLAPVRMAVLDVHEQ